MQANAYRLLPSLRRFYEALTSERGHKHVDMPVANADGIVVINQEDLPIILEKTKAKSK